MKKIMVDAKRIPTRVYNLEFHCPHCGRKNFAYYFEDWSYKKRFLCQECYKTVYKPEDEKFKHKI